MRQCISAAEAEATASSGSLWSIIRLHLQTAATDEAARGHVRANSASHAVNANIGAENESHLEGFWERVPADESDSVDHGMATIWQVGGSCTEF